jgi:hypothetical protein
MTAQISLPNLQNQEDLKSLLTNFFQGEKLKKDNLRIYILDNLVKIKKQIDGLLYQGSNQKYWQDVQNAAAFADDEDIKIAIAQIKSLPKLIEDWIRESVSSTQRFEFFILSKAAELSSGDKDHDYFYALKIRNDQLLAFLYLCVEALNNMEVCVQQPIQEVFKMKEYKYFGKKLLTSRVFEIANLLCKTRVQLKLI